MTCSVCSEKSGRTSVRPHSIATALRCWENPEGKWPQPVSLGSQRPSSPGSRGTACLAAGRDGGTCGRHHTVPRATASLELTGGKTPTAAHRCPLPPGAGAGRTPGCPTGAANYLRTGHLSGASPGKYKYPSSAGGQAASHITADHHERWTPADLRVTLNFTTKREALCKT